MLPSRHFVSTSRRGVILLVVLSMLTLFAIVGLAFVLYAEAQAESARAFRESEDAIRPDTDPELLLSYFLGQLLYDVSDSESDVDSALRGHSLARLMYGYNEGSLNDKPFNGTGRLRAPAPPTFTGAINGEPINDYHLINYTVFRHANGTLVDGWRHDPERPGWRTDTDPLKDYMGGFNVPYTYPDLNNLFLSAVKADGTILTPSFHRSWLFGALGDRTNPNWNNNHGKYLTLRPRPSDMDPTRFPYPEDDGGDVKNLIGTPGGNDSVWIDLGFPVRMGPDGRKYKALFAPLIVDLDNRLNVNVHGNIHGQGQTHASNQGWGRWEVNLGRVLNAGTEWNNLFVGNALYPQQPPGRYGANGQPDGAAPLSVPGSNRFYSRYDYDGANETAGFTATSALQLPRGVAPFSSFPNYPAGYGSATTELGNHPLRYSPQSGTDDRAFRLSNLEALLRYGDTGSQALTSELFRLCPRNFGDPADPVGSARRRRLVTTHSYDLARPGLTPWVWDPIAQPYQLAATARFPTGNPIPFPTPGSFPPANSEFATDWRAVLSTPGRFDLNRELPAYPAVDATTGRIPDLVGFGRAQTARQQMVRELFGLLRSATGAADPTALAPTSAEFAALRWLAQLAVNMVDYLDADDYMTPFNWYTEPAPSSTRHMVFGTELPRVVLNEAYVEYTPPAIATNPTSVNVWVELHNTFQNDATLTDPTLNGAARLFVPAAGPAQPAYGAYQIAICQPDRNPTYYRRHDNVWGKPQALASTDPADLVYRQTLPSGPDAILSRFGPERIEPPLTSAPHNGYYGPDASAGNLGNQGFYVIGPAQLPGTGPQVTMVAPELSYQVPAGTTPAAPTLLLRRLTCPNLPHQDDPAQPNYNPYVTVDYLENVGANNAATLAVQNRHSHGRTQPYAAHVSQQKQQQATPALMGQPQHSFFQHNVDANTPGPNWRTPPANYPAFDWLTHLDRQVISPMELLSVSGFKPHELTQQFMLDSNGDGTLQANERFLHRVLWFNQASRLYRVFEFFETHDRAAEMSPFPGVRIPGKININTIWDPETLLALSDPQPANQFTQDDLYKPLGTGAGQDPPANPQSVYWRMMRTRTPGLLASPQSGPGPTDQPFRSLATGVTMPTGQPNDQYPAGIGIGDTLLRSFDGNDRRLFEPPTATAPNDQPYLRHGLLTKLFNNVTTRSNVFAVWVTVGFFEVTDETTRPVKLGAEVGRAENRHIRHRLFAIVDRTNLAVYSTTSGTDVTTPGQVAITPNQMSGTVGNGQPWSIQVGSALVMEPGTIREETVIVTAVTATTFTANFANSHPTGFAITSRGNPGPGSRFDPSNNPSLIPYYSIIN